MEFVIFVVDIEVFFFIDVYFFFVKMFCDIEVASIFRTTDGVFVTFGGRTMMFVDLY